jgi:hypothetical protein
LKNELLNFAWVNKTRKYEKIERVFYYDLSMNTNFRPLQRHNMTKTRNKIPAKISDFTVSPHVHQCSLTGLSKAEWCVDCLRFMNLNDPLGSFEKSRESHWSWASSSGQSQNHWPQKRHYVTNLSYTADKKRVKLTLLRLKVFRENSKK